MADVFNCCSWCLCPCTTIYIVQCLCPHARRQWLQWPKGRNDMQVWGKIYLGYNTSASNFLEQILTPHAHTLGLQSYGFTIGWLFKSMQRVNKCTVSVWLWAIRCGCWTVRWTEVGQLLTRSNWADLAMEEQKDIKPFNNHDAPGCFWPKSARISYHPISQWMLTTIPNFIILPLLPKRLKILFASEIGRKHGQV